MPSKNSKCIEKTLFTLENGNFRFVATFHSLFDVAGAYNSYLYYRSGCVINVWSESHFNAMSSMMSEMDELARNERLTDADRKSLSEMQSEIYDRMISVEWRELLKEAAGDA